MFCFILMCNMNHYFYLIFYVDKYKEGDFLTFCSHRPQVYECMYPLFKSHEKWESETGISTLLNISVIFVQSYGCSLQTGRIMVW